MSMLTINETAKRTGLSSYEIRRRVHTGSCPYIRVGAKGTKILIFFDGFIKTLEQEAYRISAKQNIIAKGEAIENTGYDKIRQII